MKVSITLRAFPPNLSTCQRIDLARAAGYEGVEINLEPQGEFTLNSSEQELIALRTYVEQAGLEVSAVYNREQWLFPLTSQDAETRAKCRSIITGLVRAARLLSTDAVLVVPGAVDNSVFAPQPEIVPYDIAYQNAQHELEELAQSAAREKVFLAVENVWNKFLLSPLELRQFVDEINSPWVGVYFDVGNVLRTGFPEHWISILGSRIKRIHFKDFRLAVDNINGFVNLLEGDVNWPAVRQAIVAIGYDSWITAEVLPAYRHLGERLVYETKSSIDAILAA